MAEVIDHPRASAPTHIERATVTARASAAGSCFLTPFDNLFAPRVAAWPQTQRELLWLAPGTAGPLSPAKVCGWKRANGRRFLFWTGVGDAPAAYAELNRMPDERRRYWIGHFIVDPAQRGRGLSHMFFRSLIAYAFDDMVASEVLLVVFPENAPAIRCYETGGMIVTGRERKYFETTRRRHDFVRMCIHRKRYERLDLYQRSPGVRLPFVRSAYGGIARSNATA